MGSRPHKGGGRTTTWHITALFTSCRDCPDRQRHRLCIRRKLTVLVSSTEHGAVERLERSVVECAVLGHSGKKVLQSRGLVSGGRYGIYIYNIERPHQGLTRHSTATRPRRGGGRRERWASARAGSSGGCQKMHGLRLVITRSIHGTASDRAPMLAARGRSCSSQISHDCDIQFQMDLGRAMSAGKPVRCCWMG